jgi:hypothetical protein
VLPSGDPERLRLLLIATLQGIAALITSGKAHADQGAGEGRRYRGITPEAGDVRGCQQCFAPIRIRL